MLVEKIAIAYWRLRRATLGRSRRTRTWIREDGQIRSCPRRNGKC